LKIIRFLREHPFCSLEELGANPAYRKTIAQMMRSQSGAVFESVGQARVAAGIAFNPEVLQGVKSEIAEEFKKTKQILESLAAQAKGELFSEAEEYFAEKDYAQAAVLFAKAVEAYPQDPRALTCHGFAQLQCDFGFLVSLNPGLNVGLLNPAVFDELSRTGPRETIEAEFETAREVLERAWQAAQAKKREWFPRAEAQFKGQKYRASAALFKWLLLEADPSDVQARCFYYLGLMHLKYDFLAEIAPDYLRFGKANRAAMVRTARRLWQRIAVIRFLLDHEGKKPALTNILAVRSVSSPMASLMGGGPKFKVFSGVGEARIAAGIDKDPRFLEKVIKPDINREIIEYGIEPLSC
jgi:tetratricopeptide (TPR) repeat protein